MRDEDERKVLEKEWKRWEETTLRDALASHPERRKEFVTTSSRPVKRLYTPLDLAGKTEKDLGAPGEFPFTRGIHPTMYRGRLWTMRLVVDTFEFGSKQVPGWNTISISGYHIREAGATAAQELAFTLANGMEYVRWGIDRGLKVDAFAPRLSFFFNAHNDLFEELAKYRAARRIWAREMRDTFGAKSPRSWLLRFHTQTAGVSLTAQQPEINIVRTTIQALAAVLGGTQSLHTNAYDEAFQVPNEKAARIALRTQQILAHESGVANTVDPFGGSYFLEALTDELEADAYRYVDRIQELGGVIPAIRKGFFQQEIANSAYRYQREVEDKERIVVGVNDFVVDEQTEIEPLRVSEASFKAQVERLRRIRRTRDAKKHARSLDQLRKGCEGDANTMPLILDAVRAKATLGEIIDVMRETFGVWEEPLLY